MSQATHETLAPPAFPPPPPFSICLGCVKRKEK